MIKLKENFINEFLWSCAGVNKEILRLYPSEYAKYAGSGGTILFTALMATISGGYAMYFVFSNIIAACIFAIFWGCLIFNLDRFIVNSMHTDGKDTLSWRKLRAALPRIIMAIFLGIVISTPLEMKIFNDRIESLLLKDNIERVNEAKKESSDYTTINLLLQEQTKLSNERETLVSALTKALKELKDEAEGNALSGQAGHGTIYKDKELYVDQCKTALTEWDNIHKQRLSDIQKRMESVNTHIESFEGKVDELKEDGFSARYEAFSNLKENNSALEVVSIMITMLFIIIEVTPTFFKLIMTSGPYDEHILIENFKVSAFISLQKNTIETDVKLTLFGNQLRLESIIHPEKTVIQKSLQKPKEQKVVTYTAKKEEPEEVPYKLKSNTSIITTKKEHKIPGSTMNRNGQLVLNFSSGNNKYVL